MPNKIRMIAGPNGAGKTTITKELIEEWPSLYEFINADEIAKGLAPLHPETVALTASKLMIQRLKALLKMGKDFAFETTGAGTNFMRHLKTAKSDGYEFHLTFLWLSSPEQALKRVLQRVKQGGHNIPKETVIRRYYLGIKNTLNLYLPLSDTAVILDASSETGDLIAFKSEKQLKIIKKSTWKEMEQCVYER